MRPRVPNPAVAVLLSGCLLVGCLLAACGGAPGAAEAEILQEATAQNEGGKMAFLLQSPVFGAGQPIPAMYTCQGEDVSPPLEWREVPAGTRALALIVDDPDAPDPKAPKMTWVHWVLYNLPGASSGLPQNASTAALPPGTREGTNDWKRTGWGGPCPPIGRHRYYFKLYALDAPLGDLGPLTKPQLEAAMKGHVLGQAVLMGTYQKG